MNSFMVYLESRKFSNKRVSYSSTNTETEGDVRDTLILPASNLALTLSGHF